MICVHEDYMIDLASIKGDPNKNELVERLCKLHSTIESEVLMPIINFDYIEKCRKEIDSTLKEIYSL